MNRNRLKYPIVVMARVLGTSASGYYVWIKTEIGVNRFEKLDVDVSTAFLESKNRYGYRRVHEALRVKGQSVAKSTVQRSMQRQNLRCRKIKKYVRTINSRHGFPVHTNLLNRDFTATAPNQKWVGDITYLWTRSGWVYLAVFLDLFSRKVVGWAVSTKIDAELATKAMREALIRQGHPAGVMVHTDRGSTYCSWIFQELLLACGHICSMSRKGNCWDNAVSESFFATLKIESPELDNLENESEAYKTIFDYIECWYNTVRLHSTLGYLSPSEFENKWAKSLIQSSVF